MMSLCRPLILSLLVGYWAIFASSTMWNFVDGGTAQVFTWFKHIQTEGTFRSWNPVTFLTSQLSLFALTIACVIWEIRARKYIRDEATTIPAEVADPS